MPASNRMRTPQLLIVAVLALSFPVYGALPEKLARKRPDPGAAMQSRPELTTKVLTKRYCRDGSQTLQMTLRLKYRNRGRQSLILSKESSLIVRYMISRNVEAAKRGHYSQVVRLEIRFPEESELFNDPTPGADFVIVSPGNSYYADSEIQIPISEPSDQFLSPGDYVLQVQVPTWLQSKDLAKTLRQRWRKSGTLWFAPLTSLPMGFSVEKHYSATECR